MRAASAENNSVGSLTQIEEEEQRYESRRKKNYAMNTNTPEKLTASNKRIRKVTKKKAQRK